jgi:hypothetical protein
VKVKGDESDIILNYNIKLLKLDHDQLQLLPEKRGLSERHTEPFRSASGSASHLKIVGDLKIDCTVSSTRVTAIDLATLFLLRIRLV